MANKHLEIYPALKLLKKMQNFKMQTFQLGKIFKTQIFLILASMGQNSTVGKKKTAQPFWRKFGIF